MAYQRIPGGLWIPSLYVGTASHNTASTIDATGEKVAFCGRIDTRGGSRNIRKCHFRFGAVTKAGGSGLIQSLQNVITTGSILIPDETQDQTEAIANGDAGFAANTWRTGGALSADRTVTNGELLAWVLEYDGSGRLGADSVVVSAHQSNFAGQTLQSTVSEKVGAGPTWGEVTSRMPNIVFECDDGTFITFAETWPASSFSSRTYKQDTGTADEYSLIINLPVPFYIDAFFAYCRSNANTNNFDVVVYDGTSAMTNGTVSVDANQLQILNAAGLLVSPFSGEVGPFSANTNYRVALKPTQTTGNIQLYYSDVNTAGHLNCIGGGSGWTEDSRLDLGAWIGATATRRPLMGVRVSSISDGAGGGGGGPLIGPGRLVRA